MTLKGLTALAIVAFATIAAIAANSQQGRWAAADDATANFRVDAARQWAEEACTHNRIAETILADDFQGTCPGGKRYTKSEALAQSADSSRTSRDCRLIDADVRFFGDNLAIVYGSESAVRRVKDGTEKPTLIQQRVSLRELTRIPGREPMANGLLADLVLRHR